MNDEAALNKRIKYEEDAVKIWENAGKCICCYQQQQEEHRQLANWLKELRRLRTAPQEMTAREFLKIIENLNFYDHEAYQRYAWRKIQHDYAGAVAIVEKWAREHPERSEK